MFIILCLAVVLGDALNYKLSSLFGPEVFKEKNRILKLKYYLDAQEFFNKHGVKSIVFCRFMPIFRTIAPFVAGVARMPFFKFLVFNILGGVLWIAVMLFAGYFLGQILVQESFRYGGIADYRHQPHPSYSCSHQK